MIRGTIRIRLNGPYVKYDFSLQHKVTVLTGDSATGKTGIINTLREYYSNKSGYSLNSKVTITECNNGNMYEFLQVIDNCKSRETIIEAIDGYRLFKSKILVVDETFSRLHSNAFCKFVTFSDSYFLIISRDALQGLTYSYKAVFELCRSGKYTTFKPVYPDYNSLDVDKRIYTEDSNSGYQFVSTFIDNVDHVDGKENYFDVTHHSFKIPDDSVIFADGAAFGAPLRIMYPLLEKHSIQLFLPLSFEYLLLSSKLFSNFNIKDQLENTADYAGAEYLTWERYFTELITELTKDSKCAYSKSKLPTCYTTSICGGNGRHVLADGCTDKFDCILGMYVKQGLFPSNMQLVSDIHRVYPEISLQQAVQSLLAISIKPVLETSKLSKIQKAWITLKQLNHEDVSDILNEVL